MTNIKFDDGYKTYILNDDENKVIRVNITDFNIKARYDEASKKMTALISEMQGNNNASAEDIKKYDEKIRENINYIFGTDVCTPAFGTANCLSILTDGRFLFQSFIEAFMSQLEKDMGERITAAKYKIESKTDKYTKPIVGHTRELAEKGLTLTDEQKAYCKQLMEEMMRS